MKRFVPSAWISLALLVSSFAVAQTYTQRERANHRPGHAQRRRARLPADSNQPEIEGWGGAAFSRVSQPSDFLSRSKTVVARLLQRSQERGTLRTGCMRIQKLGHPPKQSREAANLKGEAGRGELVSGPIDGQL